MVEPLAKTSRTLHSLRPYLGQETRLYPVMIALSMLSGLAQVLVILLVAAAAIATTGEQGQVEASALGLHLRTTIGVAMAVAALAALFMAATRLLAASISAGIVTRFQSGVRRKVIRAYFAAGWDEKLHGGRGEVQQLLTAHMARVTLGVGQLSDLMVSGTTLLILVGFALVLSPALAVTFAVLVLLVALPVRPLIRSLRSSAAAQGTADLSFGAGVAEAVAAAREIQVFDVSDSFESRLAELDDQVARPLRRVQFVQQAMPVGYQAAMLLVIVLGLALVDRFDVGDLASIGSMVLLLLRAISYGQAAQVSYQGLTEMSPYLATLVSTIECYERSAPPRGTLDPDQIETVTLTDVSYKYRDGTPALDSVTLTIGAGETIGIVGPSGSGKSTLVQLLLGLLQPSEGVVSVNKIPLERIDPQRWGRIVAFVPQDAVVVRASLADNVRFFRDGISDAQLADAARGAHLAEVVEQLPDGFDTPLQGARVGLSIGQAQRLAIARALAGMPQLLVLDEPTSALDLESERAVQETLETLRGHTTMVVVAHRLSTIRACDRILVLEDGRVSAFDTPSALLAQPGFFARVTRLSETSSSSET